MNNVVGNCILKVKCDFSKSSGVMQNGYFESRNNEKAQAAGGE